MATEKEVLIDELESFDPCYQQNYKTLGEAANAAGFWAWEAYVAYRQTPEGKKLEESLEGVPDYWAENEAQKKQLEAEIALANRSKGFA